MILNRLLCPCFDLLWVVLPKNGGEEKRPLAFICGGGGSAKSGVKNQIQIMEYVGENGFEMLQSLETGDKLCCSMSTCSMQSEVVLCAAVDGSCIIYSCRLDKQGKVAFDKRTEFEADNADNSGCVNCTAVFMDEKKNMCVITGGDEGICRLWNLTKPTIKEAPDTAWEASLVREFKGHTGPVMTISVHPTRSWMCSGSRDGTFKMWDVSNEKKMIADVQLSDGTPGNAMSKKLECRGCEFSADGDSVFLIQSARSGGAHLVKWNIVVTTGEKGSKPALSLDPTLAVSCSKVPATKLKINESEGVIGVGSSDGIVALFRLSDMSKLSAYEAHDMPVTGLSFCPLRLPVGELEGSRKSLILSCSVDYRLASIDLHAKSRVWKMLYYFFIFLVLIAMICFVIYVYRDSTSGLFIS